jgi:Secretion system C-terminal sorting domain
MKSKFTLLLVFIATMASAQWSNTTNQFYDSLHMPVCTNAAPQWKSVVVQSFPDSGYFVIWQDYRINNKEGIYAQKYDKNGNRLWAVDGVPIATGTDAKSFTRLGNDELYYRNYGIACTDSAGGFYIAWMDDNQTSTGVTNKQRVCAQHVLSNGTAVFGQNGYIIREALPDEFFSCGFQQVIADGKNGFFIGFIQEKYGSLGGTFGRDLYVYDYIDEGGTMVRKAGGKIDPDAQQGTFNSVCFGADKGKRIDLTEEFVQEYFIYPNLQNGCNIVWIFSRNGINRGPYIAFNSLCRVKKTCSVTVKRRYNDLTTRDIFNYNYPKDSIVLLYNQWRYKYLYICTVAGGGTIEQNEAIENGGDGYRLIDFSTCQPGICEPSIYGYVNLRAAVIPTGTNINAGIITVNQRNYVNNAVTNNYTHVFSRHSDEVYDSLPYQLCTDTILRNDSVRYWAYNPFPPPGLKKVRYFDDTLLANADGNNYAIAAGGNKLFATSTVKTIPANATYGFETRLQELQVISATPDSFTIKRQTDSVGGIVLGRNASTGFTGTDIYNDNPSVVVDKNGNALFYVSERGRNIRVSTIGDSAKLLWGAMGRPLGTKSITSFPYAIISRDGTGVMTWTTEGGATYNDISMRHLDSLSVSGYIPFKKLKSFRTQPFATLPFIFTGASKAFSLLDANGFDMNNNALVSSVIAILDNYDLGFTQAQVYDHNGTIRLYNGKPYLNRNYTILPQNNPNGAATIQVRLFFTQEQFDALKTADPSIVSPANLAVVKQTNTTTNVPNAYIPVAGEETIIPSSWKAVDGGYYLEFSVTSFSNFFIFKTTAALPVTWVNINASWINDSQANISWQVGEQKNVKGYWVQHSTDGINFTNTCQVAAGNNANYYCTAQAIKGITNYYRVMETDLDGQVNYSKVVSLKTSSNSNTIKLYPNPAKDYTTITMNGYNESITQLVITNATGAIVWKENNPVVTLQRLRVPLKNLSSGIYLMQIVGKTKTTTVKLIKQ